jgi:NAD(P)-dependent dehydrogenase (short-subunit alcohol dehydrogenase family)
MVLFTNKLARDLKDDGINVFAVNPGHAKTQMTTKGMPKWFTKISNLIPNRRTVRQAATASIYAASDDSLKSMTGKYFTDKKETKTAKMTNNIQNQDHLWELSEKMINHIVK